tara:strand:- start:3791 stop:5344 length:1554 start_codon:yes stop_codon:yes gene_type:complete
MYTHIDRVFTTVSRNLGLQDFSTKIDRWIEWSYEAEKLIGSRDTFVQKESTYTSTGSQSTGTITFAANPTSGDSIILNGVTLYFRNSIGAGGAGSTVVSDLGEAKSPNEIQIGLNFVDTLTRTTAQYGLIQSLTGLIDVSAGTGTYINSAIYNYPEALNTADYSISLSTGDDMVTNGAFTGITQAENTTGTEWTTTDDWTIGSGAASHAAGTAGYLRQTGLTFVEGETYSITFDISSWNGVNLLLANHLPDTDGGNDDNLTLTDGVTTGDTVTRYWKQGPTNTTRLSLWASSVFEGSIDNIIVKKVNNGTLTITAKEIGTQGNDYTLSSDTSNANINGMTLTGGKGIYRNQQLRLPDNMVKLLAVRVGTDDNDYEHTELKRTSAVHRGRVGKTSDDSQQRSFRYYVDGNRLNIQHDDLDEITIVYLSYPTDLRGWPMIKEGHETAVAQYIMWQEKLIEYYNAKVPQYIIKDLEKRWYFLCSKTRGDDEMPTSEEMKQIGRMWNTLIPLNNSRGLIDF